MNYLAANPFDWNNVFIFLIAALAAWNTFRSSKRDKDTEKVVENTEQIKVTAGQLHELTNGNLSRTVASLEVANATINGLQAQVAMQDEAKRVADSAAERAAEKVAPTQETPVKESAPHQKPKPPAKR